MDKKSHRVAVLDGDPFAVEGDYFIEATRGKLPLPRTPGCLDDILECAYHFGIDSVWVQPGADTSRLCGDLPARFLGSAKGEVRPTTTKKGIPTCVHAWWHGRDTIKIFWPEHDKRWVDLRTLHTAEKLLSTVLDIERCLECELDWSPSHVGAALMIAHTNPDWMGPIELIGLPKERELLPEGGKRKQPPRCAWRADDMQYLHIIDKNSNYWGACTGVSIGEGSPRHVTGDFTDDPGRLDQVGVYRVRGRWIWTPELMYLLRKGRMSVGWIDEAWVWPRSHQALRDWAEFMWRARQAAMLGAARSTIKLIGNSAIGLLAHPRKFGTGTGIYRPDARLLIISHALTTLQAKIESLENQGIDIVWQDVDELGIVSPHAHIEDAIPGILARHDKLGGFKLKCSTPYTAEIAEALSPACSFGQAKEIFLRLYNG
jgi:hypothetical protein